VERHRARSDQAVGFAFVVSLMGCWYGLNATGGTQGVGRATTQAVAACVLIFVLTTFITKIFVSQATY
jgi:phospholipid/cholesterol/gamma-HCH transport system permease protein